MIGPSIEPSEVGVTGLLWLFLSYGYLLYYASGLISEGSELLLLVPSMAGLVGGVVLPLLGAVPDGAIILFSGLGSIEQAQETLSVGVGALAGSTIMLLTVPFCLSVMGGRVNIVSTGDGHWKANYWGHPKLTPHLALDKEMRDTGVLLTNPIKQGAKVMMWTTIPYFLIQIPATYKQIHDKKHGSAADQTPSIQQEELAYFEHWWAMGGFAVCFLGLLIYMRLQLKLSKEGEDRDKRMAVTKKLLKAGKVSLSGAVAARINRQSMTSDGGAAGGGEYQSLTTSLGGDLPAYPPPETREYLKQLLLDSFQTYDKDGDQKLDETEVFVFFKDFHETISEEKMKALFDKYDEDKSGFIDLDEFIGLAYSLILLQTQKESAANGDGARVTGVMAQPSQTNVLVEGAFAGGGDDDGDGADGEQEHEDMPEEFTALSPDQQQAAIKRKAFIMLSIGTVLVVVFSDPMVDVMQEIANRAGLSPFYVSFILAPLASNASEVIASQYYASKKTRKTITVSLTALEGAAAMNNTFCLSIFMALIFFRGLAWQYTAETIAIVVVEIIIGVMLLTNTFVTTGRALLILMIFPCSIALVAILEYFGLD